MSDEEYYARREREERAMADAAADPQARAIHMSIADTYAAMFRREVWGTPKAANKPLAARPTMGQSPLSRV